MKLKRIEFYFDCGSVIYIAESHEHNGKQWKYHATVSNNGNVMYWHINASPNKTNATRLIKDCGNNSKTK